jgi:hypothetical protein
LERALYASQTISSSTHELAAREIEREMDRELRFHREMEIEKNISKRAVLMPRRFASPSLLVY